MSAKIFKHDDSIFDGGFESTSPSLFNPITVEADATVLDQQDGVAGQGGLYLSGGFYTVTVNGVVGTLNDNGSPFIDLQPNGVDLIDVIATPGTSKVTVGSSGYVFGTNAGVYSRHVTSVTNSGIIEGGGSGIVLYGSGKQVVTNNADAVIKGGFGISLNGDGANTINNKGEIFGHVQSGGAAVDKLTNSGSIEGFVILGEGNNVLTNTGTITGTVGFGSGDDTVANTGHIANTVFLGEGSNKLTNSGRIDGHVFGDGGADTITNSGTVLGDINLGDGKNTLVHSGFIDGGILGGAGDDTVTISSKGTGKAVDNNISLGEGNNTIAISALGGIGGVIIVGAGNDKITNAAGPLTGFDMGHGDNSFTNSGTVTGSIIAGDGKDTVKNTGTINGDLALGAGDNVVSNSGDGWLFGNLLLGAGNDVVTHAGLFSVSGQISLGSGNDKFTGSNAGENVDDEDGHDTYKLGGGDDLLKAFDGVSLDNGNDIVDGGAGFDWYDASDATVALRINLDTKSFTDIFDSSILLAKAATAAAQIGTDTLTNIEGAQGGSEGDRISGNASANHLAGNGGADVLYGQAGKDRLFGGDGSDYLAGGAGADQLTGGGDQDFFVLWSYKDSTAAANNRDLILDFEDNGLAGDQIAFGNIKDAPLAQGNWTFLGVDVLFGGGKGDVRVQTVGSGWLISADINGDKKADLSIGVADAAHAITWDADNFRFTALP